MGSPRLANRSGTVRFSRVDHYDLIIVGSGSGNSIPDYLADKRIALVEGGVFGGTCLNRGCIPSKMFVLPADLAVEVADSDRINVSAAVAGVDFDGVRDRTFGRIDAIAEGGRRFRDSGTPNVTLLAGMAAFTAPHEMEVTMADGLVIAIGAPDIVLAAGARSHIPAIDGLDSVDYHTSDTIMRLASRPARLAIIGSGFIAAEMAHVFAAYGTEVTVFSRSGRMLNNFDDEIATRFTESISKRVNLIHGTPLEIMGGDEGIRLVTELGDVAIVDEILVATGRVPNGDTLNPAAAGLVMTSDGRIPADSTGRTAVDGIWAIGDVANPLQLKHLANREAAVVFWNIGHRQDPPRHTDLRAVPAAVFSHPQVAVVGRTAAEAAAEGLDVVVGRRDYGGTAYGWALADHSSFAKVVVDRSTLAIVGAQIIGPQAATLIQPLVQAMQFGQTATEVASEVFYIHPALTEVVENALLEAVAAATD